MATNVYKSRRYVESFAALLLWGNVLLAIGYANFAPIHSQMASRVQFDTDFAVLYPLRLGLFMANMVAAALILRSRMLTGMLLLVDTGTATLIFGLRGGFALPYILLLAYWDVLVLHVLYVIQARQVRKLKAATDRCD